MATKDGSGRAAILPSAAPPRRRAAPRPLRRDERGIAAVEFGLVAIPLFLLLMGLIEVGIFLVVNRSLANAAAITARQVRVGGTVATGTATTQTNGTALSPSDFKASICQNVVIISRATCTANLQIDVRIMPSFTTGTIPNPMSGKSFDTTGFCFYSGVPGQIVEMRAFYLWPLITPLLWPTLTNVTSSKVNGATTTGHWVLASVTNVFVNEPNGTTTNNGSGC